MGFSEDCNVASSYQLNEEQNKIKGGREVKDKHHIDAEAQTRPLLAFVREFTVPHCADGCFWARTPNTDLWNYFMLWVFSDK